LARPGARSSEDVIDVIVEIPAGSRNKYEYDHERHVIRLDRRLSTATTYPTDYGFVPDTLALDGDPLDALVILEDPTFPGCLVRVRVIGLFQMRDEAGPDTKLLTVLEHDPARADTRDVSELPRHLLEEISHFFSVYKELEPGKGTQTVGFAGREAALEELRASRARFRAQRSHVASGPAPDR
jgi:inorganic pyrophosphatase